MRILRGAAVFVLVVLLLPVLAVVGILFFPYVLIEHAAAAIHRLRHVGRGILVCTRRHGWEPFLQNNVLPVLPPTVDPHWEGAPIARWIDRVIHTRIRGRAARPFLVRFDRSRLAVVPLNEPLRALRSVSPMRDEAARRAVRDLLAAAMAGGPARRDESSAGPPSGRAGDRLPT